MQVGAVLSQGEVAQDVGALREYAQGVQELGYDFMVVSDHVVGSVKEAHPELERVYAIDSYLHESMSLLTFLAGVAPKMGFLTSVVILPQRQTVLAAKQAAEIDVLSGGKFRFGVGIGWNPVEYEALGMDFHTRGRVIEEQVEVMRLLWTQEVVTFHGRYHHITEAGMNPLPVQRPIPVWMGGTADVLLRRAGRMADGWFPQMRPDDTGRDAVERLRRYTKEAGRDPSSFGIEARVSIGSTGPDEWARQVEGWRELGATHISVNTMRAGLRSVDEHIDAIRRFREIASE